MRALKRKAKKMSERTSNFPFVRKNKFVGRFGFWWGWRWGWGWGELGGQDCLADECKHTHGKHIQCVRLSPAYETWLSNIFYFMFWLHCNGFCWGRRFMAEWSARVFGEQTAIHDHTQHTHTWTTCSCAIAMPNVNVDARVWVSNKEIKHYYYCCNPDTIYIFHFFSAITIITIENSTYVLYSVSHFFLFFLLLIISFACFKLSLHLHHTHGTHMAFMLALNGMRAREQLKRMKRFCLAEEKWCHNDAYVCTACTYDLFSKRRHGAVLIQPTI